MTTEIQQTSSAIISELKMIEENRKQRNQIYQSCMQKYMGNLKKQIQLIQNTDNVNSQRNKNISSAFQNVYDKIITSSQVTLRKIKQTSYQKKVFWQELIKNNAALGDLQLKKDFYLQKNDAQDRYYDAIQAQKNKKTPYNALLGKNKKRQGLRDWQQQNRQFQQKAHKQTATLNQWKGNWQQNTLKAYNQNYYKSINEMPSYKLSTQYARTNQDFGNHKPTVPTGLVTAYDSGNNREDFDFLKNFQKRK